MSKVTTTKPINPEQLDAELHGVGVTVRGRPLAVGDKEVEAPVERPTLEAAIAAHVAVDTDAEHRDADTRTRQSYAALRQWSRDAAAVAAQGTNVTQAQHKALFDRFGKLCDGLADLLVVLGRR